MPDGSPGLATGARVGPNAILQLKTPVDDLLGPGVMDELLDLCQVPMPSGTHMIPEEAAARVHHSLWQLFPQRAQAVAEAAGQGTARYIRAHRIPKAARFVLRSLPAPLAERMLTGAIGKHAWTFCGSGTLASFRRDGDVHFAIRDNPLADRAAHPAHPCHWHSAVFAELFSCLLGRSYHCREVSCAAMGGDLCHFVISRHAHHGHFKGLEL